MRVFDTHCDTILFLMNDRELADNDRHISLRRLEGIENLVQFFAVFTQNGAEPGAADAFFRRAAARFQSELKKNAGRIDFCTDAAQVRATVKAGRHAALLSLENALPLLAGPHILDEYHGMGLRMISLNHRDDNPFGGGNLSGNRVGLTKLGKTMIGKIEKRGILYDVSHLSYRSFWDAMETVTRPPVASHSCAYSACGKNEPHNRNLTDDMFRAILSRDGLVGVNLYPVFLSGGTDASVDDVVRHIEHFCSLGGEKHLCMGADLDGVDHLPGGMTGVDGMELIYDALLRANYPQRTVDDIFFENGMRFLDTNLK